MHKGWYQTQSCCPLSPRLTTKKKKQNEEFMPPLSTVRRPGVSYSGRDDNLYIKRREERLHQLKEGGWYSF